MTKKKILKQKKKIIVMEDGKTYKITGGNDRYYLCEGTQFRKSNPNIAGIVDEDFLDKAAYNSGLIVPADEFLKVIKCASDGDT